MISLQEALTVQLDEMELLETAYPEVTFDTPDPRPLLRMTLSESLKRQEGNQSEDCRLRDALVSTPLLSFRCPLSQQAVLRVRLPRRYPEAPLQATVSGAPQLPAAARTAIEEAVASEASRLSGELRHEPHCLQVLCEATRAWSDFAEKRLGDKAPSGFDSSPSIGDATTVVPRVAKNPKGGDVSSEAVTSRGSVNAQDCGSLSGAAAARSQGDASGGTARGGRSRDLRAQSDGGGHAFSGPSPGRGEVAGVCFLGRRLIYSHHIIAPQKRTGIVRAARELGLGGFSKVGWPGVIVVEGEETSCQDFVKTLRGWRWKHLSVRGEETIRILDAGSIDDARLLPLPLEELGEKEGVSALAKRCREAGLGELFATLLR